MGRLQSAFLKGVANPLAVIERRLLQALEMACAPPDEPELPSQEQTGPPVDARLEKARRSPEVFRSLIKREDGEAYGENLDSWQKQDLEVMDPAWKYCVGASNVEPEHRHFYLERGRGHSKTTDIAIMAIWAVLAATRQVQGYAAAATDDQAKLVIEAAERIMAANEWLSAEIEITTNKIVSKITGASCTAVPANAKALYGKLPSFTICDELSVWDKKEVFDALLSGLPKVPRGMMVIISNAGYGKGVSWQWKRREKCRLSKKWYFHSLNGPQASWLSESDIQQMRDELDDPEFRRCFLNLWISSTESGIPYAWIQDCTRLAGPCEPGAGHRYSEVLGALDIGLRHDRTSLVWLGVNLECQRLELLGHRTWHPKDSEKGEVNLLEVGEAILFDMKRIGNVSGLHADTWNAAMLLQILEKEIRCYEVEFSGAVVRKRFGKDFLAVFRSRQLWLFYDEDLERDLLSVEIQVVDHNKRYKMVADRNEFGHADSAFALGIGTMIGSIALEEGYIPFRDTVQENVAG